MGNQLKRGKTAGHDGITAEMLLLSEKNRNRNYRTMCQREGRHTEGMGTRNNRTIV